jgi:hypothetical protein
MPSAAIAIVTEPDSASCIPKKSLSLFCLCRQRKSKIKKQTIFTNGLQRKIIVLMIFFVFIIFPCFDDSFL